MHIYAFGSVCRGDIAPGSDIDLLAIVNGHDPRFNPDHYSIYSYNRILEIWSEGNPFAWHLSTESKLLYSSDGSDLFASFGKPELYKKCSHDCDKFFALFREACDSFEKKSHTKIFDLSMIFLGIRNFATCFSLGMLDRPDFSRHAARRIGSYSLTIPEDPYKILERARILCTRAIGDLITDEEIALARDEFESIEKWMTDLLTKVGGHGT